MKKNSSHKTLSIVKEDALDAEFVKVDEELSAQIANAFVKEDR